jgi:magnesium transporter
VIHAWICDGSGAREGTAEEAARLAAAGKANVWIDFDAEDEAPARAVLQALDIHPLVVEDMVMEVNRPKVDNYGSYIYLVMHLGALGRGPSAPARDRHPARRPLPRHLPRWLHALDRRGARRDPAPPELLANGPAQLLHFVLDVLMDHYLPIMDKVAEEIDQLEESLFDRGGEVSHERIIRLKRGMSAMRRIVGPQRDTLLALTRDEFKPIPAELRPYFRDVYDRLARINDLLDSFREEVTTLLELHVTMVSNRMNEIIKRLTVIATVGLAADRDHQLLRDELRLPRVPLAPPRPLHPQRARGHCLGDVVVPEAQSVGLNRDDGPPKRGLHVPYSM